MSKPLARRAPRVAPRYRIFAFCEGATEKHYLDKLVLSLRSPLISVEVVGQVGVPETVVTAAAEKYDALRGAASKEDSDSFEAFFGVWVVFDADGLDVRASLDRARRAGIQIAYSNPCFEVWGLVHLCDCNGGMTQRQAQDKLHELMPTYHHGRNPYFDFNVINSNNRASAITRAKQMHQRRSEEGAPLGNPYTSVHKLVEAILMNTKVMQSVDEAVAVIDRQIEELREDVGENDAELQRVLSNLYDRRKKLKNEG